jgi:uncharacterized protein (DUF2126 family)
MPNSVGNPNITEAGKATQFSKTHRPKKPGRKPSKLKKWIKDYELSKNDVNAVFTNFLFAKDIGEIEEILSNKKLRDRLPAGIAFQLQILITQAKKGDGRHLENILYMLFGRPVQQIDLSKKSDDIPDDPDERRALVERIEKEIGLINLPVSDQKGENGK